MQRFCLISFARAVENRQGSNPCACYCYVLLKLLEVKNDGGELGIRTPDTLLEYTRLAGEHLRPLGQLSAVRAL